MDHILLPLHLPRIKPIHMTIKGHFPRTSLPSVHSLCDSCICWQDGRALLMTPFSTLMLTSMISVFHLGTFILVMHDSLCVAVSSPHIVVSIIICKNGVMLINGDIFVILSSMSRDNGLWCSTWADSGWHVWQSQFAWWDAQRLAHTSDTIGWQPETRLG
jgi:hypothetical protein